MSYEPVLSIWAVGRHQALAARAITHATVCLAEIGYDYLGEYPDTPPLLDPKNGIVYRDEARIVCDGNRNACRVTESKWADLPTVYAQKHGDCKCLVAIRLAELWRQGREAYPLARCYQCRVQRSCPKCQRPIGGNQTWHMQLLHGDGRIEDISRWMGMPPHPDGDDRVVDAYDQVGVVRMRPILHGDAANRVDTVTVAEAARRTMSSAKRLPTWILNHARGRVGLRDREIDGICEPTDKNPNPAGGAPRSNVATDLNYPWCVRVRGGDSARNVAERITGDRSRYIELVAANPDIQTTMIDGAVDFTPGALKVGQRLKVPKSMKPWISQTGDPRGIKRPFPPYDATMPEGWRPT